MTLEEERYQAAVRRIGCCVCIRLGWGATPCSIHHILSEGKRRLGEKRVLGLCYSHHQAELNNALLVSRHHWKREFERRYGTELELEEWTINQVRELEARQI